jgi:hypothetical protein
MICCGSAEAIKSFANKLVNLGTSRATASRDGAVTSSRNRTLQRRARRPRRRRNGPRRRNHQGVRPRTAHRRGRPQRRRCAPAGFSRSRHADLGRLTVDKITGIPNRLSSRIEGRLRVRRERTSSRLRGGAQNRALIRVQQLKGRRESWFSAAPI